jgi:hypothetical protein
LLRNVVTRSRICRPIFAAGNKRHKTDARQLRTPRDYQRLRSHKLRADVKERLMQENGEDELSPRLTRRRDNEAHGEVKLLIKREWQEW